MSRFYEIYEEEEGHTPPRVEPLAPVYIKWYAPEAVADARLRFPKLGPSGLCAPDEVWREQDFVEVATAMDFLGHCATPVQRRTTRSYALKRQIEEWSALYADKGLSLHVSTGAVIAAAVWRGFPVYPVDTLNAVRVPGRGGNSVRPAA